MTGKELWEKFMIQNNPDHSEYEDWSFGVDADMLAELVVRGEKTATASAYPLYELENEPLPKEGEGDKSLAYWKKVHESFFTECLKALNLEFSYNMKVVCEEFEVVFS